MEMDNMVKTDNKPVALDDQAAATIELYLKPRASIFETADAVILELEMPGVSRESINVMVHNDELTVTGARKKNMPEHSEFVHQERFLFDYRRQFVLSD